MTLPDTLSRFLTDNALSLDTDSSQSAALLPALAASGLPRRGVPVALGGEGGHTTDALDAISAVAEHSLAAAFVLWGHRAFIEYLLQSTNEGLRERWLPALLDGNTAGATGLSNAMKFLSGIESLQVQATTVANSAGPSTSCWTVRCRGPPISDRRALSSPPPWSGATVAAPSLPHCLLTARACSAATTSI